MEDRIQKLELKITELENKLKEAGATAASSAISPEEFKTYQKVSAQLAICYICRRVCWPCLCPCGPGWPGNCGPCGPCIQAGGSAGNSGFNDFM